MAAFRNSCSSVILQMAFFSLFLTLIFAHDDLSSPPKSAETPASASVPSDSQEALTPALTSVPSESQEALTPASSSYIASSPADYSAASSPVSSSPQPSDDGGAVEMTELETTVTAPVEIPGVAKDVQARVNKVVQSSVISVKSKTDEFMRTVIQKRLADPETEEVTRECLQQCKENYGDAEDDVSKVVDDLNTGDYYKAMVDVEGISTFVDTCNDCMKEMVGDDPEFSKFDDWIKGVTGDCLDQLGQLRS